MVKWKRRFMMCMKRIVQQLLKNWKNCLLYWIELVILASNNINLLCSEYLIGKLEVELEGFMSNLKLLINDIQEDTLGSNKSVQ